MITNKVEKSEIIRTMTLEKCELGINNMIYTMKKNINNKNWPMIQSIKTIEYHMDCMKIIRDHIKEHCSY